MRLREPGAPGVVPDEPGSPRGPVVDGKNHGGGEKGGCCVRRSSTKASYTRQLPPMGHCLWRRDRGPPHSCYAAPAPGREGWRGGPARMAGGEEASLDLGTPRRAGPAPSVIPLRAHRSITGAAARPRALATEGGGRGWDGLLAVSPWCASYPGAAPSFVAAHSWGLITSAREESSGVQWLARQREAPRGCLGGHARDASPGGGRPGAPGTPLEDCGRAPFVPGREREEGQSRALRMCWRSWREI